MIVASSDFLLLCWLAAAVVGGMIGAAKGRAFAGAMWGLLLGPLGWLVIAAAPDQRPKCPECGGDVIPGASRCKNCGHLLHAPAKVHTPAIAEAQTPREIGVRAETQLPVPECPGCSGHMVNGVCSLCGFTEPLHLMAKSSPPNNKDEARLVPSAN